MKEGPGLYLAHNAIMPGLMRQLAHAEAALEKQVAMNGAFLELKAAQKKALEG